MSGPGPFTGQTVLVTGAAKGIGRATAERFAAEGAHVALLDRDRTEADAVAKGICARGGRALPLAADVADADAVRAAVATCVQSFGALNVLVNNAGIHFARGIDEYTDEEIERILSVNLKGALHAIRAAVPHLRQARGSIVSVSSMTGLVGQDRGAVYVATKGALISLTKALALELAPDGIRVNCVCPAGVDTPLMRDWAATLPNPDAVLREQAAMHLTNRLATGDEIAAAIAFLASPSASFITGIALPVEGGATLGTDGANPILVERFAGSRNAKLPSDSQPVMATAESRQIRGASALRAEKRTSGACLTMAAPARVVRNAVRDHLDNEIIRSSVANQRLRR